jgi:hypothetical protein
VAGPPLGPVRYVEQIMLYGESRINCASALLILPVRPLMLLTLLACAVRAVARAWFVCAIWAA